MIRLLIYSAPTPTEAVQLSKPMQTTFQSRYTFLLQAYILLLLPLLLLPYFNYPKPITPDVDYLHTPFNINGTHYHAIQRLGSGEFGVTYLTNGSSQLVIKISTLTPPQEHRLRRLYGL